MSDHYDYGYCDYCDIYHDDVKAAHKMQEPRKTTLEELDEIFQQKAAETPQQRKEGQAASTGIGATFALKRMLWDETTTRSQLGEEGYAWFVELAERKLPKCPHRKDSGPVVAPDSIGLRRGVLVTDTCPNCKAFVESLIAFTRTYFQTVPPAYRDCLLRKLEPSTESVVAIERQAEIIAMLKNEPERGYAFFAPPKAGKTVWSVALYAQMLYRYYINDNRGLRFPVRRTTI